jgi:hypothetical protein
MATNGYSHDLPCDTPGLVVSLNYTSPPTGTQAGYYFVYPNHAEKEGRPQTNIDQRGHDCTIHDLRGRERVPDLDVHGFQIVDAGQSAELKFEDDEKVKLGPYTSEIEQCVGIAALLLEPTQHTNRLVLKNTDAKRVVLFDFTIRRQGGEEGPLKRQPVPKCVDGNMLAHSLTESAESTLTRARRRPSDAFGYIARRTPKSCSRVDIGTCSADKCLIRHS